MRIPYLKLRFDGYFFRRMSASLLFLFVHYLAFSQNTEEKEVNIASPSKNAYWIILSGETGWMVDISSMVDVFKDDHAGRQAINDSRYRGYELKFGTQSNKNALYRFTRYGAGFFLGDFQNSNIGYPMAVSGWAEVPFSLMRKRQRFSAGYGGEFGAAWNFLPYDRTSNPTNVFMGTAAGYMAGFYFYGEYYIHRALCLSATLGFRHFSNGSWQQPNIGINIFPVSVSAKYQINSHYTSPQQWEGAIPEYKKRWKVGVRIAAGRKQNDLETPYFYKALAGVAALRQISHKHSIGGGLETTFSFGNKNDGTQRTVWRDIVSPAVVGCWEWMLSPQILLPVECAVYLFPENTGNGEMYRTYVRIGLKYCLTPHLWAGVTVRGHTDLTHIPADFSEWGIGYIF
jgi:hypothetical protein